MARKDGWKRKNSIRRSIIKEGELISTDEIGDRDDWICHLCLEPINPTLKVPHPGSKTLDHLIPLIPKTGEGGQHVASNVKIAHFSCNAARGNRPLPIAA